MAVKPFAVWVTGLPGSGKSVVSERLKKLLEDAGVKTEILRMDEMRKVVTPNPKYTDEERQILYNAISYLAMVLTRNNISVIIDATGNLRRYRELARRIIPNFIEAYIKCPLNLAIKRESKRKNTLSAPVGIYEGAKTGKSQSVPGIQAPYEEPVNPEIIVESDKMSVEQEANLIFKKIMELFSG